MSARYFSVDETLELLLNEDDSCLESCSDSESDSDDSDHRSPPVLTRRARASSSLSGADEDDFFSSPEEERDELQITEAEAHKYSSASPAEPDLSPRPQQQASAESANVPPAQAFGVL